MHEMGHAEYMRKRFWHIRQHDTRKTVLAHTICQGYSTGIESETSFSSYSLSNKPKAAEYIALALPLLRDPSAKCRWKDLPEQLCLESLMEGHSSTVAENKIQLQRSTRNSQLQSQHSTPEPGRSAEKPWTKSEMWEYIQNGWLLLCFSHKNTLFPERSIINI